MANPIVFKRANKSLGRPKGMTKDQCKVLPVWTDGKLCVSCWKLTDEEREKVLETGTVFIGVLTGTSTQPPIKVWGIDPFEKPFCERCKQRHHPGAVAVKCRSCAISFLVDGCIYHEDCGLEEFTCPSCDESRSDLDDENW